MIKLISRHIFFKELSFSWVPICHGWPMSTVTSQPHDCFPEVWRLQRGVLSWPVYLNPTEKRHISGLYSLLCPRDRRTNGLSIPHSRPAAAEEDSKRRCSSTGGDGHQCKSWLGSACTHPCRCRPCPTEDWKHVSNSWKGPLPVAYKNIVSTVEPFYSQHSAGLPLPTTATAQY